MIFILKKPFWSFEARKTKLLKILGMQPNYATKMGQNRGEKLIFLTGKKFKSS